MKIYRIQNRTNPELYRMGGMYPRWNKTGKTWDTLGKLRSMITMVMNNSRSEDVDNWQIIEYTVQVSSVRPVSEIITAERLVHLLKKNNNA